MKSRIGVLHKFVEMIPDNLEEKTIYISIPYATAIHRCFCGCGSEVVTPISPTDWELIFDGDSVSLYPSIGNWSLECRSHYWIKRNQVHWSYDMSDVEIDIGRKYDKKNKAQYYEEKKLQGSDPKNKKNKKTK